MVISEMKDFVWPKAKVLYWLFFCFSLGFFSGDFHYKKQLKITETCLFFPFTKGVLKLTDVMLRKLQAPGQKAHGATGRTA